MLKFKALRQHDFTTHSLVARTASAIALLVGSLVLLGWCFNFDFLTHFFCVSMVSMKANAAICFILSGVSLWLLLGAREKETEGGQVRENSPLPARVCALIIQLIGWLTFCQYLFGWNFGIDELLFRDSPMAVMTSHPGRMGLNTALNFILVGRALELIGKPKTHRSYWYAQVLSLLAGVISGLALMGYAYKVEVLHHIVPHTTSMALHTAEAFIVLCVGILWARADQGLMEVVTNDTYGGLVAGRLLIATVTVPFVLGWLVLQGEQAEVYNSAFGLSLLIVVLIISFCVLIWQNAALVERLSKERDRVKVALRVNEEKLNSFVDANLIGIIFGDIHGSVQQANDEFLRMIGYTREELQANKISWIDITPPEYLPKDEQGIVEAKVNGACTPYEKEYICKDGSRIPVLVGYTLVGEKKEDTVAFILDLSDRKKSLEALRQSEERFRLAVDNIPDAFVIYDAQRRVQFVNAATLGQLRKSKEEILGRTDEEILPPVIYEPYLATLIKAQETRTSQTTEISINISNYSTVTTFIKYVPILDKKGQIYQILGFAEDITVRKQAESALSNQQKWLEEVVNLMPTPLLLIEPGTARVILANKSADEVAGGQFPKADSAEDYGSHYQITDAHGNPISKEQFPGVRVARGERLEGLEIDWHTPSGIRSLLIFADTLPAMHGHSATCVLTFQDITNLKEVEKALSLGYTRLQLLFETASNLLSSQQPVALVDSVFKKLKEQIGLDVYFNYLVKDNQQILHLASCSGIAEDLEKEMEWVEFGQKVCGAVAAERIPMTFWDVQQSTDPKTEFIRSVGITAHSSYPLIAQGQLLGTLSFGSRSRLKFSQNELGMMQAVCDQIAIAMERASLIASLQEQTEQLREANRMKDEFLAILSHELRSPLNAILGWAQLLRSRKLDEKKIAQAIETIERNARAQTQLIDDLLDISRMIRGKLRLNVRSCNLVPMIEAAIETVRLAAEAKKIDLQFQVLDVKLGDNDGNLVSIESHEQLDDLKSKTPSVLVSGDGERLQQVIWNLLSNAIKFTPQGGRVEVQLSVEGSGEWRVGSGELGAPSGDKGQWGVGSGGRDVYSPSFAKVTVRDTGIGINSEFLPYVFDRFRQADSSITRSHGGLGLGLAIVRHLVELHGGNVSVASAGEDKGTTFTVILPLVQESRETRVAKGTVEASSSLAPPAPPANPPVVSLKGVKVLIVDDEADTRDYLTTALQQCQAEVMAVASAQEALDAMQEWKPDVLVSDIGMPEEDGYSLIRKVRRREAVRRYSQRIFQQRQQRYKKKGTRRIGRETCTTHISHSQKQRRMIPAVALTAYARPEDRMRAIKEGFQMHLPKPVDPVELTIVVATLAGRRNVLQ
ncbi:MAG: PAS domain S-box protein [Stigonema ocellatum SAG 48.90 = DSM 106950]|nr:PAS domain S-box protein [Stigonema ocellatum SAG 48.90 = DSM 106950]